MDKTELDDIRSGMEKERCKINYFQVRPSAIEAVFCLSKMKLGNLFIFTLSFFVGQNNLMLPKQDVLQNMSPYNCSVSKDVNTY